MKTLSTNLLLLLSLISSAQIIQNRSFETWSKDSISCPAEYECSNLEVYENFGIENAVKDTNAYSGKYALKLSTYISGLDTTFGYIIKGDVDNASGGIPFTTRPDSLVGYYKCDIVPGDTGLIISIFTKAGSAFGSSLGTFTGKQSTYKRFSFPVTFLLGGVNPDSMIFAAASSNAINEIGIAHGSSLTIDSVHFVGSNQTPPNADFENWTSTVKESPDDWGTILDYSGAYTLNLVEKLTGSDAHSGDYAIRIKNLIQGSDTLYGILANRSLKGNSDFGGYAYTKKIDTLSGYYRFWSPQTDSATVFLKFWNSSNQMYIFKKLEITNTYTAFELPFNLPQKPDSVQITFFASDYQNNYLYSGAYLDIDELDFKICDFPAKPSNISGVDSFCQNIGNTSFSVAQQNDATGYSWNLPAGLTISSNKDSNFINVIVDSATAVSGKIEVGASVYCGVGATNDLMIHVDSMPKKPKIKTGSFMTDSVYLYAQTSAKHFIWTNGTDTLASDSASVLIHLSSDGWFKVLAINGSCTSEMDSLYFQWGSTTELGINQKISVFPNPSIGNLTILSEIDILELDILDLTGKVIHQQADIKAGEKLRIDISKEPKGVYVLRLNTVSGAAFKKVTLIE